MTGSSSNQTLTITGTGFLAGPKVVLGCTGATVGTVTLSGSTQIQVPVNVGITAQTCTVQVTNSNGLASNSGSLVVNAPPTPPAITTLSPNPMTGSSSNQTLTINGSGFVSGLKVALGSCASATVGTITSVTSTVIQVPVNVGTTARTCTVQVTNSNGLASNTVSLQVNAPKSGGTTK